MSEINISDIKVLRNKTGAGISDCKEALKQCGGDIESAIKYLNSKGISNAHKKMDRVASEGLIVVHTEEKSAAMIELNCETDFVARNDRFQDLAKKLASLVHSSSYNDLISFKKSSYDTNNSVEEAVMSEIAVLGEKIDLNRICYLAVESGIVAGYVHGDFGKIGALVALESKGDAVKLQELGKQLAMQIVAMKPEALSIDCLNQEQLEKRRLEITEEVEKLSKPEKVMASIINGRMSKYYEEVVLLEQTFIMDEKMKIADLIKLNESNLNSTIKLSDYKLFVLGSTV